jgi:hypothetical protein
LAVAGWEKWPFLYLYLCWPHVARAPSGSVGEVGASVGLSCAHGPSSLYSPLVPVLTSRQRLVAWGEASRAGYQTACCKRRGHYDAGRSATGRPMRRLRPAQAVPLSPNGARPAQTTTPFRPTLTSCLRPGPLWCLRFRRVTTFCGAHRVHVSQLIVPAPDGHPPSVVVERREAVAERFRPCATRLPVGLGCRGLLRSLQAAGSTLREEPPRGRLAHSVVDVRGQLTVANSPVPIRRYRLSSVAHYLPGTSTIGSSAPESSARGRSDLFRGMLT